jgi:excisionase family DNA binding protein
MESEELPQLMTLKEAAKFLRLQVSTLRAWRLKKRHLAFVTLGGRVLVRRQDCETLIAHNTEHPCDRLRDVITR